MSTDKPDKCQCGSVIGWSRENPARCSNCGGKLSFDGTKPVERAAPDVHSCYEGHDCTPASPREWEEIHLGQDIVLVDAQFFPLINLRFCTTAENGRNSKKRKDSKNKYKGVGYLNHNGKWQARIRVDGKELYLGQFETEIEAAYAYDRASMEHHGKFGRRNFSS